MVLHAQVREVVLTAVAGISIEMSNLPFFSRRSWFRVRHKQQRRLHLVRTRVSTSVDVCARRDMMFQVTTLQVLSLSGTLRPLQLYMYRIRILLLAVAIFALTYALVA